jgi:hypothetical protein
MQALGSGFIHGARTGRLAVENLKIVVIAVSIIGLRWQGLGIDAIVAFTSFEILIPDRKRIRWSQLVVHAAAAAEERARVGHGVDVRHNVQTGAENFRVGEVGAIDLALLDVSVERGFLAQRPAEFSVL